MRRRKERQRLKAKERDHAGGLCPSVQAAPAGNENAREHELQATVAAIGYLKAAGYDPAGVLDLFSNWPTSTRLAKAIVPKICSRCV